MIGAAEFVGYFPSSCDRLEVPWVLFPRRRLTDKWIDVREAADLAGSIYGGVLKLNGCVAVCVLVKERVCLL